MTFESGFYVFGLENRIVPTIRIPKCIINNDVEVVKVWYENEPVIENRRYALHWAALAHSNRVLNALLDWGAESFYRNANGAHLLEVYISQREYPFGDPLDGPTINRIVKLGGFADTELAQIFIDCDYLKCEQIGRILGGYLPVPRRDVIFWLSGYRRDIDEKTIIMNAFDKRRNELTH